MVPLFKGSKIFAQFAACITEIIPDHLRNVTLVFECEAAGTVLRHCRELRTCQHRGPSFLMLLQ